MHASPLATLMVSDFVSDTHYYVVPACAEIEGTLPMCAGTCNANPAPQKWLEEHIGNTIAGFPWLSVLPVWPRG